MGDSFDLEEVVSLPEEVSVGGSARDGVPLSDGVSLLEGVPLSDGVSLVEDVPLLEAADDSFSSGENSVFDSSVKFHVQIVLF